MSTVPVSGFWVDVNPGMIEDCLTENDFVAVVSTDLLGGRFNEDTADAPLLEEGEKTVNNNSVRLVGYDNDKIHYMASHTDIFQSL